MTEHTNSGQVDQSQEEQKSQTGEITILADYFSLANEIVQPDQYVSTSRYFCLKWEPFLGLVGARIVRVLRSLGYYNRQTGETRDGIPIDLPELAALCGFSVATIKREFGSSKDGKPANPFLHTFVQREKNYKHDAVTGQIWREENIYRVKMDDPVHPDDLPRLQELWESRQKGGKRKEATKTPSRPPSSRKAQNDPYGDEARRAQDEPNSSARKAHLDSKSDQAESKPTQSASKSSQDDSHSAQNEPTLIDSSSFPKITSTSSSDAPEFSLSLFQEQEGPLQKEKSPSPCIWSNLSEREQLPWLDQAQHELVLIHTGSGITPKPKLIEVRAKNLYEKHLSEMHIKGRGNS